jgi:flavin reductase (NADH)/flavin reductase
MTVSADLFRRSMRRLVASVCIVTAGRPDHPTTGLTATSVCSVSAEPPTLLCCIDRGRPSYAAFLEAGAFGVNVLAYEDRELANRFARRMLTAEKFEGVDLRGDSGSPLLSSAMAGFDCRLSHHVEVATHGILFGEIVDIRIRQDDARPLLYAHGGFGGFTAYEQGPPAQRGEA